jgi:hypothetical protein
LGGLDSEAAAKKQEQFRGNSAAGARMRSALLRRLPFFPLFLPRRRRYNPG